MPSSNTPNATPHLLTTNTGQRNFAEGRRRALALCNTFCCWNGFQVLLVRFTRFLTLKSTCRYKIRRQACHRKVGGSKFKVAGFLAGCRHLMRTLQSTFSIDWCSLVRWFKGRRTLCRTVWKPCSPERDNTAKPSILRKSFLNGHFWGMYICRMCFFCRLFCPLDCTKSSIPWNDAFTVNVKRWVKTKTRTQI